MADPNKITPPDDHDELIFADEDDELIFADDDDDDDGDWSNSIRNRLPSESEACWKVMLVDDEPEIHNVTKLALSNFIFQDKRVVFVDAYSGKEAKQLIQEHPDTALILLDVVMEADHAGLEVVRFIRQELDNQLVRIVLRTGQPGQAPEGTVMIDYDINDYRPKGELTSQRLYTAVVAALRAFQHLQSIETHRREIEKIAAASARFVPQEFLSVLDKNSIVEVKLGDQIQQKMTIMFADVRAFTSISENMSPEENFSFLNELLRWICPPVREYNGFIDKYLGDGIMALFSDQADDAVQAAIAMLRRLNDYNNLRQTNGKPIVELGIGLHTGMLMLGTIGEESRMEGTVISDAVNVASRVEGLTKQYGASLVISQQTLMSLADPTLYSFRFIDRVMVKGKHTSLSVYEVFDGEAESQADLKQQTKEDFEQGLLSYYQKKFPESSVYFNKVLEHNQADEAARLYLQRAAHYMVHGVPDDWEGIEMIG
ncbi:adenylate/guanylate cyclase domain-containing protein [Anaerolineales bacterium HSG25]|nr:adenylate/guanylate cyclase domain-containing protein [Anaerolineales bacterium HSG25]